MLLDHEICVPYNKLKENDFTRIIENHSTSQI